MPRAQAKLQIAKRPRCNKSRRLLIVAFAFALGAGVAMHGRPAQAQPSEPVDCAEPGQPLVQIPELRSRSGKLRGTMVLSNDFQRLNLASKDGKCRAQDVRQFRGVGTVPAQYPGLAPNMPAPPASKFADAVPGPTLRARVGDMVQLTFLNQISSGGFWKTLDRAERGEGCDENASVPYPGPDTFPDCFHGSSTGNIHFHGTHTTPSTTGDNIFIEVRPSTRDKAGQLDVTQDSVRVPFEKFFADCEKELNTSVLSQWPRVWADLPDTWRAKQQELLEKYDTTIVNKLWPVNEAQIKVGAWPQYHIGGFPFCFRLPEYTDPTPPNMRLARPPARHTTARRTTAAHVAAAHATGTNPPATADDGRVLQMGQAPGLHWYHAHKHGSTTINVSNGMTGAFVIEGKYDDDLNAWYGTVDVPAPPGSPTPTVPAPWTRAQPVFVINQLGTVPNLFKGSGGQRPPFSVNGRVQPKVKMRPGEAQLWRIVNTSWRSGVFFNGIFTIPAATTPVSAPTRAPFEWKQLAQDGVQFTEPNYDGSKDRSFLVATGNRVDILVKAPQNNTGQPQVFNLLVADAISRTEAQGGDLPLLSVEVASGASVTGPQSEFISGSNYPAFPPFLGDIALEDVKTTKTITFESAPPKDWSGAVGPPFTMHTIDGKKFDGNVGQVVLLNTVEEWKIENRTTNTSATGPIDHPFHIHINPFQVVEVFDPNEFLPGTSTKKYIFEGTPQAGQCLLDIDKPAGWKPCDTPPQTDLIWWDVFPIPSGRQVTVGTKTEIVAGYFKMRSRFVDYTGQYVIHCHILAHEDRGMMTVVQVVPYTTAYSHK